MLRTISFLLGFFLFLQVSAAGRHDTAADTVACTGNRSAVGIVTQAATSAALNLALTEVLKRNIHEMRPNGADNHSWPSRHTSWAFMAASSFSAEMYGRSGWWGVGAHTAANIVAMERCFSENHFPKDVLGGAAVGITSTVAGVLINRLIFREHFGGCESSHYSFVRNFDAVTRAVFYPGQHLCGSSLRTGITTLLRVTFPLSARWGFSASAVVEALPLYNVGRYNTMRKAMGMLVGAAWNMFETRNVGVEARTMAGVVRNSGLRGMSCSELSYGMDVSVTGIYSLSRHFAIGCEVSYVFHTNGGIVNALSTGLLSRVNF